MEKRITLTHGFTRMRWLFVPIGFFTLIELFSAERRILLDLVILMTSGLFFFLFWSARKMKFDSKYLYIIKGAREKIVPLKNVKSLKRSKTKVNGSRFWIMVYEDEGVQERKCRFMPYIFGDYSKEFKAALQKNNPEVVIWNHPYFNH